MKNLLLILCSALLLTSCFGAKTGKVGDVNLSDMTYFKDYRTDLCFGIIGAKQGLDFASESTSIGVACVPCEKVAHLLINKK